MKLKHFFSCLLLSLLSLKVQAAELKAAVAANFTAPMKKLVTAFEQSTEHRVLVSFSSSGKLYAQILHGAPFEVFLSADKHKPEALIAEGKALSESQFTYALGALALWSAKASMVKGPEVLQSGQFNKLAIANPKLAPYGMAAIEVIDALTLPSDLKKKLVQGENITQVFQYVVSGNADLGFIALAQLKQNTAHATGSSWLVPKHLYQPIYQDAVLLNKGQHNPAALAFLRFLKSDQAISIIEQFGYDVADLNQHQ